MSGRRGHESPNTPPPKSNEGSGGRGRWRQTGADLCWNSVTQVPGELTDLEAPTHSGKNVQGSPELKRPHGQASPSPFPASRANEQVADGIGGRQHYLSTPTGTLRSSGRLLRGTEPVQGKASTGNPRKRPLEDPIKFPSLHEPWKLGPAPPSPLGLPRLLLQ